MKRKFFLFMDKINIFCIYLGLIMFILGMIAFGLCFANEIETLYRYLWVAISCFGLFVLFGNCGYRAMPKFFRQMKFKNVFPVVITYALAIFCLIISFIFTIKMFFVM